MPPTYLEILVSEKSLIILGRTGCGRTTLLLETFCNSIKAQPSDNVLFLLPTHSQAEHIKDVIIRKGFASGFIERGICTFSQLARETLGHEGLKGPITELEKGVILREVLRDAPSKYFERKEEFQGLHMAMLRFFKELKEDGQYPAQFRRAVDKFLKRQNNDFAEKYLTLAETYSLYQTTLEKRGLLDEDDLLNQLLHALENDNTLLSQKKLLLVDGFHDFTPVEFRILKLLIERIPRVLISLVLDAEKKDSPIFEHCQAVYRELKSLRLKPQLLQGFHRSASPTLRHIEKDLFNPASERTEADDVLEIVEAADIKDEVEQIARRIYKMVSRGEVRYQDIAIVFREISPYRNIIETVFNEYNIPVRIHTHKLLIENPLVKGLLSLLKVFTESWRGEEVLHALKSPYVMLPHAEVDSLEYEILEKGKPDSREAWLKLKEPTFANWSKTKTFIRDLAEMEKELDGQQPPSFFRSWFMRLINRFLSLSAVEAQDFEPLLKEEAQGLKAFLELLDRQCQVTATPITFEAFLEELLRSLSCASYTLKDKRHEVVNVIDALEARQWEKPVVFVGGLLEKQFPMQGREDIFLKDKERGAFKRLTGVNLQEVLKRTHEEERFLFYIALTRAQHRLILSYPATDSQGRPTLPSFYLEEVKKLLTHESFNRVFHKRGPGDFIPKPQEVLTQKDLRNFVFHHLTSPFFIRDRETIPDGLHNLARRVYNRELGEKTHWLEGLRVVLERPEEREPGIGNLLKEIMSSFSATQLSNYAQCPFLHFCRWVLKLRPLPNRIEEGLSPTLQGEIIHDTLKRYYGTPKREGTSLDALFQESFSAKTRGIPIEFKEAKLKKEMLHALKVFAEQDEEYIKKFPFSPRYFEVGFGKEVSALGGPGDKAVAPPGDKEAAPEEMPLPPLELRNRNGTRVKLTGRIDRIDIAEIDGETLGLVIDYKYSREAINGNKLRKDLSEGTDLQLPIYVMVARDLLGLRPAGAQFYSLKPPGRSGIIALPLPNDSERITQEEMEDLLESCKDHLFRQVEGILTGDKRINPRDTRPCRQWCEYRDVCRFERSRPKRHDQ